MPGTALAQDVRPSATGSMVNAGPPDQKMENRMKLLTTLMVFAAFAVAGCNTMSGMGEDIQKGGEKIENAADKRK